MKQYIKQQILRIFGNKVKQLRIGREWSQESLGIRAGLHRTYIGSIERNERNISLLNVERIARALEVPVQLLITERKSLRMNDRDDKGALDQGAHAGSIYRTKEEQFAVIMPFLINALRKREKCLCIVENDTKNMIVDKLHKRGISADKCSQWGQFLFLSVEQVYLKNGHFDSEGVANIFKNLRQDALSEGFYGQRIIAEATKRLVDSAGHKNFTQYEARLNYFFPGTKVTALDLYEEDAFNKEFLLNAVVLTHPKIFFHGRLVNNTYYKRPHILTGDGKYRSPADAYERIKAELLEKSTG